MIIDSIDNAARYYSVHPLFREAFEALAKINELTPAGRIDVDGEAVFINNSSYVNKPVSECRFESHKKYIDIQYVVSGHENIDVCACAGLDVTEDNLDGGDIAFFKAPSVFHRAGLRDGEFVVLFPGEAHRPLAAPDDKPVKMIKAVAKVLY